MNGLREGKITETRDCGILGACCKMIRNSGHGSNVAVLTVVLPYSSLLLHLAQVGVSCVDQLSKSKAHLLEPHSRTKYSGFGVWERHARVSPEGTQIAQ